MPGRIETLTHTEIAGWAQHPKRADYAVTLNVFLSARLVHSRIVRQEPTSSSGKTDQAGSFVIRSLSVTDITRDLRGISVVIGETDERLVSERQTSLREVSNSRDKTIEDILSLPPTRKWVSGLTYVDALERGLPYGEVLDLLYRDILGRPADESGYAHYMERLDTGKVDFDEIRNSFLSSGEFASRPLNSSNAPGTIFSRPIVYLSLKPTSGPS